jgi:transcriptional regulator with XRE-family HTH domain
MQQIDVVQLRVQMAIRNWTQGDLADASGISRQTINYILQGYRLSVPDTVQAIADALGVHPDDLIEATDDTQEVAKLTVA